MCVCENGEEYLYSIEHCVAVALIFKCYIQTRDKHIQNFGLELLFVAH